MKNYKLLALFIFFIGIESAHADEFLVEEDLSLNWVFLDNEQNLMLPFLDNSSTRPYAIHLLLRESYSKKSYVRLAIPSNASLFIQNKFIEKHEEVSTRFLGIDSLINVYEGADIKLTLYNKDGFSKPVEAKVGFIHRSFDASVNVNPISQRQYDDNYEYLKIIILIVFIFFVILFNLFRSDLFDFLSVQMVATLRLTETAHIKYRTLTKSQLLVIVYQAVLMSAILTILFNYYNNPFAHSFFVRVNPILSWMMTSLLVLVLFVFKYFLINVINALFNISEKTNFYFIEYFRMAMIFYSLVFLVMAFIVINKFHVLVAVLPALMTAVILFNLVRFIILYFKFRGSLSMKSMHLFSYLCTTELIPIVLGLKFFLK